MTQEGMLLLPNGELVHFENCRFEVGSRFTLGWGYETPMTPLPPKPHKPEEMSMDPQAVPVEPPHESPPPEAPAAPTHETAPSTAVPTSEPGIESALSAASYLKDSPWAPLVMVVLAVVAVLGGRQGWKFWSERSAQQHELEMKKLELQAQANQAPTQQPPPCIVKQTETDAKLAALDARLGTLDARIDTVESRIKALEAASENNPFAEFDPDDFKDLDKRLKKLEKSTKPAAKPASSTSSS